MRSQLTRMIGDADLAFDPLNLFDSTTGRLKRTVFEAAMSHIKPTSSPGYPFTESKNEDVDIQVLYELVEHEIRSMISAPDVDFNAMNDEELLNEVVAGRVFPASSFIKSEPTDVGKIARNIYGESLVKNVVARIIFGEFLMLAPSSRHHTAHKVGLDFMTEGGIADMEEFIRRVFSKFASAVSDDVQGWEYNFRLYFLISFLKIFVSINLGNSSLKAEASARYAIFVRAYSSRLIHRTFVDSDGYVHRIPFFIMFSGIVLTHVLNSLARASLAKIDQFYMYGMKLEATRGLAEMTNGDDCSFGLWTKKQFVPPVEHWYSTKLGFVHTDIKIEECDEKLELEFSSQIFRLKPGGGMHCYPSSVAKTFFNVLASVTLENQEGFASGLAYLARSPAYVPLRRAAEAISDTQGKGSFKRLRLNRDADLA